MNQVLQARRDFCEPKLALLRDKVKTLQPLATASIPSHLCIYVTGSFGRLDASQFSDLDVFLVSTGSAAAPSLSKIDTTLVEAGLIEIGRKLGFPEFSNEGQYLAVHFLDDMLGDLGSPNDDCANHFTARMLLLLESRPIFADELYDGIITRTVETYFRDYPDHEDDFKPIFLINDIIRFWRTLCLNYEHRRNRPAGNRAAGNKSHLKNLKLKFSRMLTCFATIQLLSRNRQVMTPGAFAKLVTLAPFDRLRRVADGVPNATAVVTRMEENYSWFLEAMAHPAEEVLAWIGDRPTRNGAFAKGRLFAADMYELLRLASSDSDTLRFLVI
jgi:hypothetical protein